MAVSRVDPFLTFNFTVEIHGLVVAGFNDVSGLAVETEVETFREGGLNSQEQQLPGATKVPTRLTLKRGLTDADALWAWYQRVMQGQIERKDISILLMDASGKGHWRWNFVAACPVKWTGPELKASSAEVAFETVEFLHKGVAPNSGRGS